jgi:maltose alpha-D-glucosyltransferase / alpha-amylase
MSADKTAASSYLGGTKRAGSASDPLWYKDAILYELHVKAFADSNNDGIGDFQGLIQKLDLAPAILPVAAAR